MGPYTYGKRRPERRLLRQPGAERPGQAPDLRIYSRVSAAGEGVVCVIDEPGKVDADPRSLQLELIQRAQATRTELRRAITSAAADLLARLGSTEGARSDAPHI